MSAALGEGQERAGEGKARASKGLVWIWLLSGVGVFGLVILALYANSREGPNASGLAIFASGVGFAGAAVLAGILVGFLFGLPRLSDRAPASSDRWIAGSGLSQVADWLTKIVIGLGLVQIGRAPSALAQLATAMGPSLGGGTDGGPFSLALVLSYFVIGFLIGFLWSEVYFLDLLRQQDDALVAHAQKQLDVAESEARFKKADLERTRQPSQIRSPGTEEIQG